MRYILFKSDIISTQNLIMKDTLNRNYFDVKLRNHQLTNEGLKSTPFQWHGVFQIFKNFSELNKMTALKTSRPIILVTYKYIIYTYKRMFRFEKLFSRILRLLIFLFLILQINHIRQNYHRKRFWRALNILMKYPHSFLHMGPLNCSYGIVQWNI